MNKLVTHGTPEQWIVYPHVASNPAITPNVSVPPSGKVYWRRSSSKLEELRADFLSSASTLYAPDMALRQLYADESKYRTYLTALRQCDTFHVNNAEGNLLDSVANKESESPTRKYKQLSLLSQVRY